MNLLETSKQLEDAYIPIALQGQTVVAEDWAEEPPFHYAAFVATHGRVWELDGGRMGPVDRGAEGEVVDAVRACIKAGGEGAFSLMALVAGLP
jgi:ubiquitin carboxyl-terminal hydrolase L3